MHILLHWGENLGEEDPNADTREAGERKQKVSSNLQKLKFTKNKNLKKQKMSQDQDTFSVLPVVPFIYLNCFGVSLWCSKRWDNKLKTQ